MRSNWRSLCTLAVAAAVAVAAAAAPPRQQREKVSNDIACGMCAFAAEDLWVSLVGDWAAGTKRGAVARSRGALPTAAKMLTQMCAANSPILPHFVDMFDIQECSGSGSNSDSDGGSDSGACGKPGRRWYLKRDAAVAAPPPAPNATELNDDYQAALGEAIKNLVNDDTSFASALAAALGGKELVDMGTLRELLDSVAAGTQDSEEMEQIHAVVGAALEKRAAARRPPPPTPPREKTAEERVWHLQAYTDVCSGHLREIDDTFTMAIGAQFVAQSKALAELANLAELASRATAEDPKVVFAKVDVVVVAGRAAVAAGSCAEVCEGEPQPPWETAKKTGEKGENKPASKGKETARSEL